MGNPLHLFPNLLASKIKSHCLNFHFSPLLQSVLKALLNKSASLLINAFLLRMYAFPCQESIISSPYYSYYSKLAKETTIPSKTCPWHSSNLKKFILGEKYKNIHNSTAHNSKNLETAQMSTDRIGKCVMVYSRNEILYELQLPKSTWEKLRNIAK